MINPRTLMRMPRSKVAKIAFYWGVDLTVPWPSSNHEWKRQLVNKIWWSGYGQSDMKTDFGQWRHV